MQKYTKVWAICADPVNSSCIVTGVYLDRKKALDWVKRENKRRGVYQYWVEQSELIK